MRFSTQPSPLLRILKMLAENGDGVARPKQHVTLIACDDRLWVAHNGTAARMEAIVFEEGQCTVSTRKFLLALEPHRDSLTLMIQVSAKKMQVDQVRIPVSRYSTAATPPSRFQIFLATNHGIVPSIPVPLQLVTA